MKKLLIILIFLVTHLYSEHRPEIHCKHFIYGYPYGTSITNDLIIRDLFALSNNDSTKLADWVVYKIDIKNFEGPSRSRNWAADPWLADEETLEPEDYKDANAELKTDRGHQAPLANFKGSEEYYQTNYLSNITPQSSELNQGPWRILEEKERDFALKYPNDEVYVMMGPIFDINNELCLPQADEPHQVPVAYWRIIVLKTKDSIQTASFILSQTTKRNENFLDFITTINEIESATGLDFLWELEDESEEQIESQLNEYWIRNNF